MTKVIVKSIDGKQLNEFEVDGNDLIVWTVGSIEANIFPDLNMLKAVEQCVKAATEQPNGDRHIFVPPFVKVEKIKLNEK